MLRHNIDHVLVREGQMFAYGWGFLPGSHVTRLVLRLAFNTGLPVEIDAEYGRQRDDVRAFFPDVPEAENAGFLLFAGLGLRKIVSASLRWEFEGQQAVETPFDLSHEDANEITSTPIKYYKTLFIKAIALLRSGGINAVIRKTGRYLSARPQMVNEDEWDMLRANLQGKQLAVVVDHDMGGGANIYRKQHILERCANGELVLLLGFHVATLQYFIEIFDGESSRRYSINSPESLLSLASCGKVRHIIYNCAVSFRQPLAVIDILIALKRQATCELLVTVHDFFIVCPSHFLIDNNGRFCGVPDKSQCKRCLADHHDGFVSISGVKDIERWRQQWSKLLVAADEVRVFSNSSKEMLKKAYPLLPDKIWRVVPHVLHTRVPKVEVSAGQHLHIGIVGTIGKHKGSQIISDLASEIVRSKLNAKITVIGTLEAKASSKVVTVTGHYAPENLAAIIANSGANIFFFPSIWAETFSYVSHELVAMGLPFACFDFGAPADLARKYEKGIVIGSMNTNDILNKLENFWREIYTVSKEII